MLGDAFAALHRRRRVGATIRLRIEGREASGAPPSPSRHDPWRFFRCVWICVIAFASGWSRPLCCVGTAHSNMLPGRRAYDLCVVA